MRIALMPPGGLPVPAVRGGAVESLMTSLLDYNERRSQPDEITVFSRADDAARAASALYKHSNVVFVPHKESTLRSFLDRGLGRISPRYLGNEFIRSILSRHDLTAYDRVIVENMPEYGLLTGVERDRQVLHMHNDLFPIAERRIDVIAPRFSRVFAASDYLANKLHPLLGADASITTVHNGIDIDAFAHSGLDASREAFGIPVGARVVLYAGRVSPEKGVRELVQAFLNLSPSYPDAILLVVGGSIFDGSGATAYTRDVSRLASRSSQIRMIGYVERSQLPLYYSVADVGVVPSLWEEPFGLVLVEQMAAGLPSVASRSGGMLEVGTDRTTVFVDVARGQTAGIEAGLRALLDDSELRAEIGIRAQKRAADFSAGAFASSFFEGLQ